MNEMKPNLSRRLRSSIRLGKFSLSEKYFRVPFSKGVALPWMKWYPSFNDGGLQSVHLWKISLAEKWVLKYATLGFLFIRVCLPMNEMIPILWRWLLAKYTAVKSFTLCKVSVKPYNLRVTVYKEVGFPWIKWYPSFEDDCWQTLLLWKV